MITEKQLLLMALVTLVGGCLQPEVSPPQQDTFNLTGKNILMVIAPENFRDEELLTPKGILKSAGAKVTVASQGVTKARGMLGAEVAVDVDVAEVKAADYDAVLLVGGSGASLYFDDPVVWALVQDSYAQRKVTAAICLAPVILANAGLLEGKQATVWSSERRSLEAKGALYQEDAVVVDGSIITANGPPAAEEWARKVAEQLSS